MPPTCESVAIVHSGVLKYCKEKNSSRIVSTVGPTSTSTRTSTTARTITRLHVRCSGAGPSATFRNATRHQSCERQHKRGSLLPNREATLMAVLPTPLSKGGRCTTISVSSRKLTKKKKEVDHASTSSYPADSVLDRPRLRLCETIRRVEAWNRSDHSGRQEQIRGIHGDTSFIKLGVIGIAHVSINSIK